MRIYSPTDTYQFRYRPTRPYSDHKPRMDSFPHHPHCNTKGYRAFRGKSHRIKTEMTDWTTTYSCNRCDATARIVWIGDATRAGRELAEPKLSMSVNPYIGHSYS